MARCPFAHWEPLPANAKQARMTPRLSIAHTAVDAPGPTDLFGWFAQSGLESHFFVHLDGALTQYMDTNVVAEANYKANNFAVSYETEDEGHPGDSPWTNPQVATILRLNDWLCTVHPIPRRQADRWDGAGLGWHSMWGVNTRTNMGINPWTTAVGKTCPGAPRITQMRSLIIPRIASGQPVEEVDMQADERMWLSKIYQALFDSKAAPGGETLYDAVWVNRKLIGAAPSLQLDEAALKALSVDIVAGLAARGIGGATKGELSAAVDEGIRAALDRAMTRGGTGL